MNCKGVGRIHGLMEVYPVICLGELRKAMIAGVPGTDMEHYQTGQSGTKFMTSMLRSIKLLFKEVR
jgi:hypothetical protein